jgi:hypothetical protein
VTGWIPVGERGPVVQHVPTVGERRICSRPASGLVVDIGLPPDCLVNGESVNGGSDNGEDGEGCDTHD